MVLTLSEAEKILRRVFSEEIEGSTLSIEGAITNPNVTGPAVQMRADTFDRVMVLLSREPRFKIDAIKLYREVHPGVGLAEAKDYVERIARTP